MRGVSDEFYYVHLAIGTQTISLSGHPVEALQTEHGNFTQVFMRSVSITAKRLVTAIADELVTE